MDLGSEAGPEDTITFTVTYLDKSGTTATFTVTGHPDGNNQAHNTQGSKANCG